MINIKFIDEEGVYPSHSEPKHDLESLIYVIVEMCGYQLPWGADMLDRDFESTDEYLEYKSNISDKQIIELFPSFLIKPFKYIMKIDDSQKIDYETLR